MQEKLLNEIIGKVIGRQAIEIVNLLVGKKNVNEFLFGIACCISSKQSMTSDAGIIRLYTVLSNPLAYPYPGECRQPPPIDEVK